MACPVKILLALIFLTGAAFASTPTATISDADGTVWANCRYTATLTIPGGESTPAPTVGGVTVSPLVVTGTCNASGTISPTLTDTSTVDQKNAQWVFKVQSNTSAGPVTVSTPVVGSAPNLTTSFSLLPPPRFAAGVNFYGYADSEIQGVPLVGQTYYNVTTPCLKQYSLAGWTCGGGSSTSTAILLSQIPTNGLIGLYTHVDCTNPYKDYSGNGNDGGPAVTAAPTCQPNGLAYFVSSVPAGWKLPAAIASNGVTYIFSLLPSVQQNNNGPSYPAIVQSDTTGGILGLYGGIQGTADAWSPAIGYNSTFNWTYPASNIPSASTVAYSIGTGVAGDLDQLFSNGTETSYVQDRATTNANFNKGNLVVGGFLSSNYFYGIESVALVYNRKLTSLEHQQVASALNNFTQNRSGLVRPIPTFSNATANIVCNGDSITNGLNLANSWCTSALLNIGVPFVATHTAAINSQFLAAIAMRAPQITIPYYSVTAPSNTAYIFAGTNDMAASTQTPAQVWTNGIAAIAGSRWGNAKVVWMPMISRTGQDPHKDSLNALSNAQCATSADYCVAPTDPLLYADGANSGTVGTIEACPGATTYFQADCVHPTTAGQTLLALYASNAWKQLYGSTQAAPTQVSTSTYTVLASDNYITATANSVITLYNCLGYSKFVAIKVMPGLTVTVKNATSAQTIDGTDYSSSPLALTAGSNYTFQVVPGAPATGGCTWVIN